MDDRFRASATPESASALADARGVVRSHDTIRVVRLSSIHDIQEEVWDSLSARVDLYHTHRFIRSVEDAGGEPRFRYLLFYQADGLAATAALSSFPVHLDLFLGPGSRRLIGVLRRIFPSFLLPRVLFCGLPVSIGKNTLAVASWMDRRVVLRRLVQEMTLIALEENVRFLCVKEFLEEETPLMDELCREGFMKAESLPYAWLQLYWGSFEEYLHELRHGYRRKILHSLGKLKAGSRAEGELPPDTCAAGEARLVVGGPEVCPPATFHALYLEVMRRTEVILETLSLQFFERLYDNLSGELVIHAVVQNGRILGAAICAVEGRCMTFLLVGIDYSARDAYDVYFNLVHGITRSAIERGCTRLDLGQTSYGLKSRIGAETTRQSFYFRAENGALHRIIEFLRPVLFPGVSLPQRRVLKSSTINGAGARRP